MTIAEALENVGAEVAYVSPEHRVVISRGTILGADIVNPAMVTVRYAEGDHATCPVNLRLRSKS